MPQEQTQTEDNAPATLDRRDNAAKMTAVDELLGINAEESVTPERAEPDAEGEQSLSKMLAEAEKAATDAGVHVLWVNSDATTFRADEQFDAAICLCEGAFGLLDIEDDPEEHHRAILRNINAALPVGASFLMTTLNGYRKIRAITQENVNNGEFDPVTMVHLVTEEWDLPDGKKSVTYKERLYILPELVRLFESEGFHVEHVWGGTAGNWGRREIDLDEMEVMIVARKDGVGM